MSVMPRALILGSQMFEDAVMWKENTEIESKGFPLKREVREKNKRLIGLTLTLMVIAWSKPRQGVRIKKNYPLY